MLGTVQFGMPYGIANRSGQPSDEDVLSIVKAALAGGVNCFDTAASYGTSEEVLGRTLRKLNVVDKVIVVTKVRLLSEEERSDPALAAAAIEESVAESRRRLKMDCLPIVLFHRECYVPFMDTLIQLRDRGWLRHFGVSCDNKPGTAVKLADDGQVSAFQIPANILDHRHRNSGIFERASAREIAVFVRSVYLQGLLVMPEENIPTGLREVIPARRALQIIADQAGITLSELALRYMLSQFGVTSVITGVETVNQVHDNLAMFSRGSLPDDVLLAIHAASMELSESLLTPSAWSSDERQN